MKRSFIVATILPIFISSVVDAQQAGKTSIAKWQDDKASAVSLTFDDGSPNQFSAALPILNRLHLPATFFIITGQVAGSDYHGKFIGRPVADIIRETADTLTNKDNFFERASAIPFLGYKGTLAFHTDAGTLYESGKIDEAYHLIDSGYRKVREHAFEAADSSSKKEHLSWDSVKAYASQGHEFSSHTVTHPRLSVLTEPNIVYELEKSKEDIRNHLGERYTFSAECPYGTEDERVMSYAYKVYPALRNRMPEPFLEEITRFNNALPGSAHNEYVQWQKGATTKTPLPMMKSWVDTVNSYKNNWLVLVFHGVDGIGYEALRHELLQEYFEYIRKNDSQMWIATFGDVTRYMRERMNSQVSFSAQQNNITVQLNHHLDTAMYDIPLTLITTVPRGWKQVVVAQGTKTQVALAKKGDMGNVVMYQAIPNKGPVTITKK